MTAKILYHPHPVLAHDQAIDHTFFDEREPLSRQETKAFMKANSVSSVGATALSGVVRRPFAGELIPFPSPDDPEVIFQIKRCGVAENIARQNLGSTMRYVERGENGEFVTERDFPVGDMNLQTVKYGLGGWNLLDDNNAPLDLTLENIQKFLSPTEFSAVYEKVVDVNPMWGRGEAAVKKS